MVMKSASVAELKARLSHFLRIVRTGEQVEVLSHHRPVARIIPSPENPESFITEPSRRVSDVRELDRCAVAGGVEPLSALLEDRARR
jgi:prevent-host-death family protein